MKTGSITQTRLEVETITRMIEISCQRLYDLGIVSDATQMHAYIHENVRLNMSPLKVLKKINLDHLLAVFHNNVDNIKLMVGSDQRKSDPTFYDTFDLSEDETNLIFNVHEVGVEHPFDLVVYNRHNMIGIECEYDAAPALNEELTVSIWDNLPTRFEFAEKLNFALDQSGIEKHYEIMTDDFLDIYIKHTMEL